jgi:hypothetical protein
MTEKLLVGILVGIAIWLATNAVGFLLRRYRLKEALLVDIRHRISNLNAVEKYLTQYFKDYVKKDAVLERYARYTKDEFPFYDDVRGDLYQYFGAQNLIAIMRCYEALGEIEILMEGLSQDFLEYREKQKKLSDVDVQFFNRKKSRIESVIGILKKREIHNLGDIPRDYQGVLSAASIITK